MNQHEHRQELTKIMHDATQEVKATTVKPRKAYVTTEILAVSVQPIPELIDLFGMIFPTARQAADGWIQAFAKIEGGR